MSDTTEAVADVPQLAPEEAATSTAAQRVAPMTSDFLPPSARKHVDGNSPVPLRMMAAKALVPLSPADMLGALFLLTFDPDAGVREQATKTASTLPDRMLAPAFRDENVKPQVLAHFLELYWEKEDYAIMLILNASTPDEAVAVAARKCTPKVIEVIGQNQLRILRHDDIIRQLCQNPQAVVSLVDSVCDFAVRSGLHIADVPQMKEARIRIFGPDAAENPPDPGPTAEELVEEYKELTNESAPPMDEGRRLTLTQRIMKMNIAQKIKLATMGNKEARGLLIRDSNKLVAVAVIRSPRITDGEVMTAVNNRSIQDDVLRVIYSDREWTKMYPVKLGLVKNPKTPQAVSLRLLNSLHEADLKKLARDKNVPNSVQMQAKKLMDKKNTPKKDDK